MAASDWWTTDLSHIVTCNLGHYFLRSVQWTFWCLTVLGAHVILIIIWVGSDGVPRHCGLNCTSLWWQDNNRSVWGIGGLTDMGNLRRTEFYKQQKLTLFFVFRCVSEWRCIVADYTTITQQNKTKLSDYFIVVIFIPLHVYIGARGSVVGWGTMLQAGKSQDRVPMRWIFFQFT
jgi:hypothetical protein